MNYQPTEVVLTVNIRGTQAVRGSYTHFNKVNRDGYEINGIKTDRPVSFCECTKTISLGKPFVDMALSEPPVNLKDRIRGNAWRGLTESKRIALHVNSYVKAMHPEHLGYNMEIL